MKKPSHSQPGQLSRRKFLAGSAAGVAAVGLAPSVLAAAMGTGSSPAVDRPANYCCAFSHLSIYEYGVFRGYQNIGFNLKNVIVGSSGTGKTTILHSLANQGLSPKIRGHFGSSDPEVTVEVVGNPELLSRYHDLIFLYENFDSRPLQKSPMWLSADNPDRLEEDARRFYWEWLPHGDPMRKYTPREVLVGNSSAADHFLASLSYVFAAREQLDLSLPLVMERPIAILDQHHGERFASFLWELPWQVILLVTEPECSRLSAKPNWCLTRYPDYSRVVCNWA